MLMLIVLVLFPVLILMAWNKSRLSKASASWPSAPGVVTASGRKKVAWRIQPSVTYRYEVAGRSFDSSRVTFAELIPVAETEPVLFRYPPGRAVNVYYNPANPAQAILEPGPSRFITANLRTLVIWFCILILLDLANLGLAAWNSSRAAAAPPVHSYGDEAKADPQLGNRLLRAAAEKGDATDQVYVGLWYLNGKEGYPKDPAEAAKWMRKSADQGNRDGQYWLGILYAKGMGVEKNPALAIELLTKAANQGEIHASFCLGEVFEKGLGGQPKDPKKAIEWYRKSGNDPHVKEALKRLNAAN